MSMKQQEYFNISRFSDHTLVSHKDQQHDIMMIFFSGLTDMRNTSAKEIIKFGGKFDNYGVLFRKFAEELLAKSNLKIKIVIPHLLEVPIPNKPGQTIKGWFEFDRELEWWTPDAVSGEYLVNLLKTYNRENDEKIMSFVENQMNMFNNNKNVIFSGYSQGGRYVSVVLQRLQVKYRNNFKIGFIVIIKAFLVNIFKEENIKGTEINPDLEEIKLNKYYVHLSEGDKLCPIKLVIVKTEFLKKVGFDLELHIDQEKKHVVDKSSLDYLEGLIYKHYLNINVSPNLNTNTCKSSMESINTIDKSAILPRLIILATSPRSFSTVILRTFLNSPHVKVFNDPLGNIHINEKVFKYPIKEIEMSIRNLENRIEEALKQNKIVILKDIANVLITFFMDLLIKWKDKFDTKFMYLLRHPKPRYISYQKIMDQESRLTQDYKIKAKKFNFYTSVWDLYQTFNGRIIIAEELQENPSNFFKKTFEYCGLPFSKEILNYEPLMTIGIPEEMNLSFGKTWYEKSLSGTSFEPQKVNIDKIIIEDGEVRERLKKEEKIYNRFLNEKYKQDRFKPKF